MTLSDAGPLVALIDDRQPFHAQSRMAIGKMRLPLVTSWPCFTEAMYLLNRLGGWPMQNRLWNMYSTNILQIHAPTPDEVRRMQEMMRQYQDLPMDLADASLVAMAESRQNFRIFTFDKHFYAYRTEDGRAMEVISE